MVFFPMDAKEREKLLHCWWECKIVQPLWKAVWRFLKKLKVEIPYNPAFPFLRIYPKKTKSLISKDICTPMFIVALFTIAKICKQPKCPLIDNGLRYGTYTQWNIIQP